MKVILYRNNHEYINETLVTMVMLLLVAFFTVLPFRNISVRHMVVFAGSILFYFLAGIRLISKKHTKKYFVSFAILLIIILFEIVVTVSTYSYETFYSALNFIALFILMTTESTATFSKKSLNRIYYCVLFLSAMVFLLSYSPVAYVFEDGRFNGSLVLGMTNSNIAGMMISGLINVLLIFFKNNNNKQKILIVVIITGLMYLLVLTNCRSAIICSILVIIYALFFSKKKLPNWLVLSPVFISIIFVPVYLYLFSTSRFNTVILGKAFFSGRQITYRETLAKLTNTLQWLFGNYGAVPLSNAHNAPLCIMCSFGIIGFVIIYWNFARRLIQINNSVDNYYGRMAIACFMSLFVQSSMEALMLTGIFPSIAIIFLYAGFCGLGSNEISTDDKKELSTQRH